MRGKPQHQQVQERAGDDLTFSAPKSLSLACLVNGDRRLEAAHRQAAKTAMEVVQARYAQTRIKGERIQTDNLTVAIFHHDTSRDLDPQLHSHCFVANTTQKADGTWQSRTAEAFYHHKMVLGQIYRNQLALAVQQLGYEIEVQPSGLF